MCRINPRIDFAFKKLFGSEENKDILIDLINSIVSESDRVQDLVLKNPYNEKSFQTDKLSVLDIKAQDEKGNWFNIEMQIISQQFYDKRSLYYWARIYNSQLDNGRNYDQLKKTICINILNFDCLQEKDYHNIYKIYNTKSNNMFFEDFEIHFIELNKYDDKLSSVLDRWVNFLKKADLYSQKFFPFELEQIPSIKKALNALEKMFLNEEERELYEGGLKWYRDYNMAIRTAEIEAEKMGMQAGEEIGRKKGIIQTIISFLDVLDNETISHKTGISIEEIERIRQNQ